VYEKSNRSGQFYHTRERKMSSNEEINNPSITVEEAYNSVSCREYLDVLMYCYSPANQLSTYYQKGLVDDCQLPFQQLKLCIKYKSTTSGKTDEEKLRMYEQLKRKNEHSKTAKIWEMRTNPKQDWNSTTNVNGQSSVTKIN
jgi:hypothetical protein